MSRFRKLTHAIWHCQYHIVWVPKYRYRVLEGDLAEEVSVCLRIFSEQSHCEVVEMNIQKDHVHLIIMVPPESIDIRVDGTFKRSHGDTSVKPFQRIAKEALLGEPSLGSGILRGYRRHGRRNDTALCPVSRETREKDRRTATI